jgi:hypothetical protein
LKTNQEFPKVGFRTDQLVLWLKFKRRTDASALGDYKRSKGIMARIRISTSKEALLKDFKMPKVQYPAYLEGPHHFSMQAYLFMS